MRILSNRMALWFVSGDRRCNNAWPVPFFGDRVIQYRETGPCQHFRRKKKPRKHTGETITCWKYEKGCRNWKGLREVGLKECQLKVWEAEGGKQ